MSGVGNRLGVLRTRSFETPFDCDFNAKLKYTARVLSFSKALVLIRHRRHVARRAGEPCDVSKYEFSGTKNDAEKRFSRFA